MHPAVLFFPLAAAMLYPLGSIFLKRAMELGSGPMRAMVVGNLCMCACFGLLAFRASAPPDWSQVGWPILTGCAFFIGQVLTIVAIRAGDVSVQAPLMGTKVVFVALYSFFLQPDEVPPLLWIASALTAVAVFLIGGASPRALRSAGRTITFSLLSCAFFGLSDTLMGYRSQAFGTDWFIVGVALTFGALSFLLIPFCKGSLREIPKPAWKGLILGGLAMGGQALILNIALTTFGHATAINVVYSSRGLWGVLLVWFAGSLLGNFERRDAGPAIMRRRFLGSLLLCGAIALVFL
jgi:drug/metabolite transporter (DMT)-like permease